MPPKIRLAAGQVCRYFPLDGGQEEEVTLEKIDVDLENDFQFFYDFPVFGMFHTMLRYQNSIYDAHQDFEKVNVLDDYSPEASIGEDALALYGYDKESGKVVARVLFCIFCDDPFSTAMAVFAQFGVKDIGIIVPKQGNQ